MAQCMLKHPDVRAHYVVIVPFRWLDMDPEEIGRIGGAHLEEFAGEAAGRRAELAECGDPDECKRLARRVVLDRTLPSEAWLRGTTGLDHASFFYIASCFRDVIRKNPGAPLFRSGLDPARASNSGNRCSLVAEHMLCMFLHHM